MTCIIKLLNNTRKSICKLGLKKVAWTSLLKKHCVSDGTREIVLDGTFQYWR